MHILNIIYITFFCVLDKCCSGIRVGLTNILSARLPAALGYYTYFESDSNDTKGKEIWKSNNNFFLFKDPNGFWTVRLNLEIHKLVFFKKRKKDLDN